jgi:hypothetical protein
MVAHTLNSSTQEAEQADLCDLRDSLVYKKTNSRTARATQRNPVTHTQKKTKTKTKSKTKQKQKQKQIFSELVNGCCICRKYQATLFSSRINVA